MAGQEIVEKIRSFFGVARLCCTSAVAFGLPSFVILPQAAALDISREQQQTIDDRR
jgi:hypothetical protein